ncbi:LLM class flavin-dependent oxidoreductase [Halalkalicoccus subterraneus]|uniref:LLM class flavin-dependent oxidoreductase n=1 Tax=Halalkalicoccus subterraneus TaxID=2675002 RepID=UPI000EFAD747|nr:LLM class flavin-dependent oxidoreductase [Halalkalicoccus subterraneus]
MKFGVYVNPQTAEHETGPELREGILRIARTAEEAGFDQVMAGQHYLSDFTQLQLLPFLGRLTGEVGDMEIATGIVLLPFYHPVEIAEQVATIDALHDGPTAFGVGAGYRDAEFEAFGIAKSERVPRLIEGLQLTRRLLTEERVTHDGEFYSVTEATIPIQPENSIPVWLAANADRAVERSARIADAWLVNPHATVGEIKEQKARCYDPIREDRGENTKLPVIREAFVAPTHEEAVEIAREHLEEKYQRYVSWGQDEAMEDTEDLHRPFEELAEDRFVLGTPAEVCAELERYEEELDASHVVVRSHWPGLPYERACESLELMGEEVLPNV